MRGCREGPTTGPRSSPCAGSLTPEQERLCSFAPNLPSMSLLHEARQCIANQAAHKALNAFVSLRSEAAILGAVEDATAGPSSASARSPLAGRLVAVKDNICTSGLPTTSASGVLSSFTSPYDATVVRRLQDAGAVVVGKTNLDEFGMGSHSTHSRFGAVRQLQEQDREGNGGKEKVNVSAGGSSGGSAVAVKMGMCWAYAASEHQHEGRRGLMRMM